MALAMGRHTLFGVPVPSETAPYWITIAVATVAWLFTNATTELLKTPYLIYNVTSVQNRQDTTLIDTTLTVENITNDKAFNNVELRLIADEPDIILSGNVRPYSPAWEGDEIGKTTARSFDHIFPKIQPGGKFDIYLTHKLRNSLHIVLVAPQSDIFLTESDTTTFLVAHHLFITLIIATFVIIISAIFLIFRSKNAIQLA
jgi:hypothetical protein